VTGELSDFQKRLCNRLQKGLPIDPQPFACIAGELGCAEERVLDETRRLRDRRVIRRIGAILDHRTLGMHSTLVAAQVPAEAVPKVAEAINQLPGVSHSYLRRHAVNLWFTLQDRTPERIDAVLADLRNRFGIEFHSLPVAHMFKLDVFFDAFGDTAAAQTRAEAEHTVRSAIELTEEQRRVLSRLEDGVEIASRPFDTFLNSNPGALALLQQLLDLGVIRRIAAIMDHRKLGYVTNVLFVAQVPAEQILDAGRRLAGFPAVSHCYHRRTFEGWPYNLYAMLHGSTPARVQETVDGFLRGGTVPAHQQLQTEVELKKHPVRLSLFR
jgi:siroheme decarboxylase